MSSEPVTSEPQQRGERSSHTGSVADFIAMLSSWRRPATVQPLSAEQQPVSDSLTLLDSQV